MNVNRSYITRIIKAPRYIQKIFSCINLTRISHKQFQKVKFLACKFNNLIIYHNASEIIVQSYIARYDKLVPFAFRCRIYSAQNRLDSCRNLTNVKRLGYIIVRTVFKSEYLIYIFTFRRNHNYRYI